MEARGAPLIKGPRFETAWNSGNLSACRARDSLIGIVSCHDDGLELDMVTVPYLTDRQLELNRSKYILYSTNEE